MENAIKFLRIQNFKSIKDVTLHPRRVNLIIGEPNVGKSNLLEAMTLLGGITYEQTEKFMGSFIRYEEPRQLFYDNLVGNTIKVETDKEDCLVGFRGSKSKFAFLLNLKSRRQTRVIMGTMYGGGEAEDYEKSIVVKSGSQSNSNNNSSLFRQSKGSVYTEFDKYGFYGIDDESRTFNAPRAYVKNVSIRPYSFRKNSPINQETGNTFLNPSNGDNLIEVIQTYPQLRQEIGKMFEHYGQKLQLRMDERRLETIKDQDGIIYSYPYSSVADTLQRIIFYLAAIESNDDAVLLFEEPEAHSFPVYVSKLGRRIVESTNNQFFIDTHSPYLITEVLETMLTDDEQAGELAMFAAYYEDHQTKVHQLSDEEIRSIRNDGIDVFYNMKRFTTGAADA